MFAGAATTYLCLCVMFLLLLLVGDKVRVEHHACMHLDLGADNSFDLETHYMSLIFLGVCYTDLLWQY